MPTRDPLSGADNAWRRMGRTDNLMTITGILWFDRQVGYEELCDRLASRLLRFDRFKQKVGGRKRRLLMPYWETVEEFDIESHVYDISLPEPADDATFQEFVGRLMSRPLDERRPLWEAYLVEDVDEGPGNAMAIRINHSIGDGFALLYVLLGLVDDPEGIEFPIGNMPSPPGASEGVSSVGAAARRHSGDSGASPDEGPDFDGMRFGKLGAAVGGIRGVYDLATMSDEPETSLRGDLGQAKRAGWTDEIDLDRIKEIKREHDATVNDVLLAVTAGALRRVLEGRGEDTAGLELRCTAPVNLTPMANRDEQLGNGFGLAFLPLPVGTRDLDERIRTVRDRTGIRKIGIEAFLMYRLLRIGGRVPEVVQEGVMSFFENRSTAIVTNVPGPMETIELAGAEVTDLVFWVPQAIDQGIGISLLTYDNSVRVGVAADANLLSDAAELSTAFEREVEALEAELATRR
jgi:WS/DGAT/MGAT family acyltransferase